MHPSTRVGMVVLSVALAGFAAVCLTALPARAEELAPAATYYVDAAGGSDTTGDGNSGSPWQTISYALSQVSSGDTVSVLSGTYNEALGEVFPIDLPTGVSLVGSGCEATIISGQGSQHVLLLDGTSSDILSDTVVSGLALQDGLGGLRMYATDGHKVAATIESVCIRWNNTGISIDTTASEDGGIVAPVISNTHILSNTANGVYMRSYGYYSPSDVSPQFISVTVEANGRYGIYLEGSAVMDNGSHATPYIVDSRIVDNTEDGIRALGAYRGWARPHLERCRVSGNGGWGLLWDEGVNGGNFHGVLTNTVIADNESGGIYLDEVQTLAGTGLQVLNCTLPGNGDYGIYWTRATNEVAPNIVNTILWNLDADDLYSTGAAWTSAEVSYSDIEDGDLEGVAGNISADPLFQDDVHVNPCSPVVDAGTGGAAATDIDGQPRPMGAGTDIGADEADLRCVVDLVKLVSSDHVLIGDVFSYTIMVTNTTVLTPLSILLTDTLPVEVEADPGSVWASTGDAVYATGTLTWSGTIAAGGVVSLGVAVQAAQASTTLRNEGMVDVAGVGTYVTNQCVTVVDPFRVYLPLLLRSYCSDFFDDFSNPASGWSVGEDGYVIAQYLSGEYRVLSRADGYLFLFRAPTCARENHTVELDARWASAQYIGASYGILFGLRADYSEYYLFDINTDFREYGLWRRNSGGGFTAITGPNYSSAINTGTASNHLKVTRNGTAITLEINGTVVGTWYDGTISGLTYVGLASSPYWGYPVSDARFDNFAVTSLVGGGAAAVGGTRLLSDGSPSSDSRVEPLPISPPWLADRESAD